MNYSIAHRPKLNKAQRPPIFRFRLGSSHASQWILTTTLLSILLVSCRQKNSSPDAQSSSPDSAPTSLTLGVVTTPYNLAENYTQLEHYLEKELSTQIGSAIDIKLDPLEIKGENPLQQARNRLAEKKWDIAFTTSPILSVAAINNDYEFVARMFPQTPKFESSLFVLQNSPIQGLEDLTPDKTIALGEISNPSNFYIPVYDLYGKILKVDRGNPDAQSIVNKVKSAQADVGAAPYPLVAQDPQLRVIQRSRSIPLSGVYLSPNLSNSDRKAIQTALLKASEEIQKKSQYGSGEEPDYQYLIGITNRVDTILSCVDLDKQPVEFYCAESDKFTQPGSNDNSNDIVAQGQVNGYQINANRVTLTLNGDEGQTYRVSIDRALLDQIPNALPLAELQDKTLQLRNIEPTQNTATIDFKIERPQQLTIFN